MRRRAELQSRLQLGDPTLGRYTLRKGGSYRRIVHLCEGEAGATALCTGVRMSPNYRPMIIASLEVMLEHNGTCRRLCRECIEALP
jgi:hypothetical protein